MADEGEKLTYDKAAEIEQAGVYEAYLTVEAKEYYVTENGENAIRMVEKEVKVIGNGMVDINGYVDLDAAQYGINEKVSFKVLKDILESSADEEELEDNIKKRVDELVPKHIILDDIYATISYYLNLCEGVGVVDDIDHLRQQTYPLGRRAASESVQDRLCQNGKSRKGKNESSDSGYGNHNSAVFS